MCIEYIEYIYMIYCDIYILFVIGMSEWSPRRRNFQNHLLSVLSPRRSAMPWLKHKCTHLYSDRIRIDTAPFHIGAMVWRCILGLAPDYLRDLCCSIPGTRGRSSLCSSEQGLLFVPFARTSTSRARALS